MLSKGKSMIYIYIYILIYYQGNRASPLSNQKPVFLGHLIGPELSNAVPHYEDTSRAWPSCLEHRSYAQVVGSILGQGSYKKQPTTDWCFFLSLPKIKYIKNKEEEEE